MVGLSAFVGWRVLVEAGHPEQNALGESEGGARTDAGSGVEDGPRNHRSCFGVPATPGGERNTDSHTNQGGRREGGGVTVREGDAPGFGHGGLVGQGVADAGCQSHDGHSQQTKRDLSQMSFHFPTPARIPSEPGLLL